jgi:hypothetical protein
MTGWIVLTIRDVGVGGGFWNEQHMDHLAEQGTTVLIPPDAGNRKGERPGWTGGRYSWMRHLLKTDTGSELYR